MLPLSIQLLAGLVFAPSSTPRLVASPRVPLRSHALAAVIEFAEDPPPPPSASQSLRRRPAPASVEAPAESAAAQALQTAAFTDLLPRPPPPPPIAPPPPPSPPPPPAPAPAPPAASSAPPTSRLAARMDLVPLKPSKIRKGDFVVHSAYGIGRFDGVFEGLMRRGERIVKQKYLKERPLPPAARGARMPALRGVPVPACRLPSATESSRCQPTCAS